MERVRSIPVHEVENLGVSDPVTFGSYPRVAAAYLLTQGNCYYYDGGTFRNGEVWLPQVGDPPDEEYGFEYPQSQQVCDPIQLTFLQPPQKPRPNHILLIDKKRLCYVPIHIAYRRLIKYVERMRRRADRAYTKGEYSRAIRLYELAAQVSEEDIDYLALCWATECLQHLTGEDHRDSLESYRRLLRLETFMQSGQTFKAKKTSHDLDRLVRKLLKRIDLPS